MFCCRVAVVGDGHWQRQVGLDHHLAMHLGIVAHELVEVFLLECQQDAVASGDSSAITALVEESLVDAKSLTLSVTTEGPVFFILEHNLTSFDEVGQPAMII